MGNPIMAALERHVGWETFCESPVSFCWTAQGRHESCSWQYVAEGADWEEQADAAFAAHQADAVRDAVLEVTGRVLGVHLEALVAAALAGEG